MVILKEIDAKFMDAQSVSLAGVGSLNYVKQMIGV